jgi:hypothetical protein
MLHQANQIPADVAGGRFLHSVGVRIADIETNENGIGGAMSEIRILSLSMNCAGAEISLGAANTMKQKKGDKYQSVPAALKVRLGSTPVATLIHDSLMA